MTRDAGVRLFRKRGYVMDFSNNIKYFKKRNYIFMIVSALLVVAGVIIAIALDRRQMWAGIVVAVVGVLLFFITNDSRPKDSDLDGAIQRKVADLEEVAKKGIDYREKYVKAFPTRIFTDYDFSHYETEGGDFMIQRGSDSKYRTNRYAAAAILFGQETLHIYLYRFYLTKAEEERDEHWLAEKYVDLDGAVTERREHTYKLPDGKEVKLENLYIIIKNNNGENIFEFPVNDGDDVDKAIQSINRMIESKKSGKSEIK